LRNVLPCGGAGAAVEVGAVWVDVEPVDCCPGMCWVCWPLWSVWLVEFCDCEPEEDEDACEAEDEESSGVCGSTTGICGRFIRSSGMSGGAIGGCPLIISGPLALFSSVDQPPLPSVAPMLHDT